MVGRFGAGRGTFPTTVIRSPRRTEKRSSDSGVAEWPAPQRDAATVGQVRAVTPPPLARKRRRRGRVDPSPADEAVSG
ncbi:MULTISPECIES: hypothetical protein [unclassified Micromonospora]|uniref:hypothetical protein n=1 Tax=unclassified Micromonospora TaxID=2617518 RepID=UPI00332E50F3